jgi:class 3 adenylate cyclase/tetratricopeptide (TPR) repeat protein
VNCPNCGSANEAGRKFCGECGTRLARTCPSCGSPNASTVRFCGECGTQLENAVGPGQAGEITSAAPAAVSSRAAATTERRLVSVLFADLVGFTSLAAARDSEDVRDLLSRYFDTAREIVERYGGTVEKFIGDAVMAVWGTPVANEDDAERAVRTGLDLIEAVRGLDSGADGRGLEARAGVLTGEAAVTVGATGQGMVAGDLVNTASRLQSVAPPGAVLVGEATQRAAARAVVFEPVGEQMLKGKTTPVPAWRAVRVVAKRGGEGRSEGLEAPFVGRDDELRLLKDFFHVTSRERRARLISVIGQAGIGKSRLAWEFLKYVDGVLETIYWHEGRSPAFGEGVTFWALGEMVRRRAGLAEGDDEATTRARIAATLAEFVPDETERAWIEPALLILLGFGDEEQHRREELFAAWRTFFERVADVNPAILVFEDLQWADPGLLDFVDHLLEWSTKHPIFIVALARPDLLERRSGWGAGRRNYVSLSLEPLTESAMRQLLAGLVPGLPERAVRAVLERADGIPLYAVETVRMLVAEGKLESVGGAYRPTGDLGGLAVPETLHALIAARLDGLDPADRTLIQDGAVLGQTFPVGALGAMRDQPADELEPRLRALVRREILTLDTDPRSPERGQYGFSQALLRDVAYGTLAKKERRARHLAAARYFESLGEDAVAGVLAMHYLDAYLTSPDGEEADAVATQARIALRAAADRAMSLGSHEQGIAYLRRALTVTRDPVDEAQTLERIGSAAAAASRFEEADAALRRALEIVSTVGDQEAIARARVALAGALLSAFRSEEALSELEPDYAAFVEALGDHPLVAEIASLIARAHQLHEDPVHAIEWAERALAISERLYLLPILAEAIITKGSSLSHVGRVWEGIGLVRAGQLLAEANGLVVTRLRAAVSLSGILAAYDPRQAFEIARDGYDLALRLGYRHIAVILVANGGEAALSAGEFDWAVEALSEMASFELSPIDRATLEGVLIELAATRGDPTEARLEALKESKTGDLSVWAAAFGLATMMSALADGRFADAHDAGRDVATVSVLNRPYALLWATRAALRGREVEAARAANRDLVDLAVRGPALDAARDATEAGILALDGRWPEAAEKYRDATRRLREMRTDFDLALALLEIVELAPPGDPLAASAADEARALFRRMGAVPYVAQLDAALATASGSPTARREQVPEAIHELDGSVG